MPKLTGVDFLRNLNQPPKVIFTTAYRDYALEGYELNALDYLLKPISFERFLRAINKVYQMSALKPMPLPTESVNLVSFSQPDPSIYVKADKKMVRILLRDILYIESLKDYVRIKTPDKQVVAYQRISYLEEKLPEEYFMRIHRSYIVAKDKIEAFANTYVEIGGKEIPIGRNYKREVSKILGQDNLLDE